MAVSLLSGPLLPFYNVIVAARSVATRGDGQQLLLQEKRLLLPVQLTRVKKAQWGK